MRRRLRARPFFAGIAIVCAMAVAGVAPAQEQIPTIRKEVRLVLVEVTVKNKAGQAMKAMKQDDFRLYENGESQLIEHFSQDRLPLAVALLVDTSTSIQPYLGSLRSAARLALHALKAEDEVALFTFSAHAEKRADLTRDKQKVSAAIEKFGSVAGTNINNALYDAARYLRDKAPAARRVIVLVSDNVPSVSGAAPDEVLKEVLKADTAVYSLKVPASRPADWPQLKMRGFVNVNEITQETGGEVFEIAQAGMLQSAFQTLVERLKGRYTLGFYERDPAPSQKWKKLEVKLRPSFGVKGKDYTIAAKNGYYPASTK